MNIDLADSGADPRTFVELLRTRAGQQPEQRAYTFLTDGEAQETHVTYAELDRQARSIAALMQSAGAAGERALLLYPPGLEYVAAFFGCLYAGAVAVPAYPPDPARLERTLPRLRTILQDASPRLVLTTTMIAGFATALAAQDAAFGKPEWLATDALPAELAEGWRTPDLSQTTLALLQYTSGSTAAPKGVMLTHANLLHNSVLIQRCFAHSPQSCGVIWLPPYHDMGLIGGIIQPLYAGFPVVLMSPLAFLQRPLRWLQAISRYGATTSGGPNFAYDLCMRKTTSEQRAALDLSSWRAAFNGAEPIRPETLARFADAFAASGFRHEAFYPCYGLAEATLIVSGGQAGDPPVVRAFAGAALARNQAIIADAPGDDVRVLVGCGRSQPDQPIIIVDPDSGVRCASDQVGEIWLAGPSIAAGYWARPDETAQTFGAMLADGARPFLRTGDLGFVHEGELFVTGRLKDLIIIRGRNLYPQDIELAAERSHPMLRPGGGAAFAVEVAGEERLVVVQEIERSAREVNVTELTSAIRRTVAEQHETQVYAVALIAPGSIPKTSSGKIQRHVCRAHFQAGELELIGSSALDERGLDASDADEPGVARLSRTELLALALNERQAALESYLRALLERVLGVDPDRIEASRSISSLGIDSLLAVELQHQIEIELAAVVPMVSFLQDTTIGQFAALVLDQLADDAEAALASEGAPLAPTARNGHQPLSFAQQHLWLLHQFLPENFTITIPVAVRLEGALNLAALQRSLNAIMRRHATLRTTFSLVDGQPAQQIAPTGTLLLALLDLRAFPPAQREAQALRLASAEAHSPFDLARGPLVRATLLIVAPQAHVLLLTMHHIVSDGWSMGIFVRELAMLYMAFAAGQPDPLPALPIQYVDFAIWQRQWLTAEVRNAQLAYWRDQLDALPVLELPLDRLRPAIQTFRGAWLSLTLPWSLTAALKELSRREEATLFMTLLAAFDVLLARYSGQDDIAVGTPITGRNRVLTEGLIGFFANVLVLRADLSGDPSFRELLRRVRGVCLQAYTHQDLPFEQLVRELQPTRDLSRTPLFQVLLNMLNLPDRRIELPGLTIQDLMPPDVGAKFDLTLYAQEQDTALRLELVYNADLFERTRMVELLDQFAGLLAQVAAQPEAPIASFSLVTPAARARLPDPAAPIPLRWDEPLPARFARQARRFAERPAVIDPRVAWSYADLDTRANQLAHYLIAQGVQPQDLIAIYAHRSAALDWALLGILKAGAAFMILNPSYPPPQLIDRLRLAEPRGWLQLVAAGPLPDALAGYISAMPWRCRLTLPEDDAAPSPVADCSTDDPLIAVGPEDLAYITFTSGSTGLPKAIMGEHRPLSHFLAWYERTFALSANDQFSMLTGLTNDPLLRDIFTPLWLGATLHIPHPDDIGSARLIGWMQPITVAHLTPATVRMLLDSAPGQANSRPALPALRYAIVNGDVLTRRDVIRLRDLAPAAACLNVYGATEAPQITIYYQVEPDDPRVFGTLDDGLPKEALPIGRGIEDVQLLVFNAANQLAGVSELGELYIRTPYLARGYMGNEALTRTRFLPNPFTNLAYDRIYRTGDLGRFLPDGNVEFYGRRDQQVKIRGFRVELEEVEGVLAQHPGVVAAAVSVWEVGGDRRLVAYVVTTNDERRTTNDAECDPSLVLGPSSFVTKLRAYLAARLPDYMVPAAFVALDALPLMPSGKLDRRALPPPEPTRLVPDDSFVAPRTTTEVTLAQIWADVLELDEVGVYDEFFALGGHSLLATQVVARVRDAFAVELPLRALFEASTVAGLAEQIERDQGTARAPRTPSLRPVPRDGDLPLSLPQQRLWFLDQLQPGSPVYNIPAAVHIAGSLDVVVLQRSLNAIIHRHETLRTTFAAVDGQPIQIIAASFRQTLTVIDLELLPARQRAVEVRCRMLDETQKPFDLTIDPLLRATLLRLDQREHILLVTMHHIVSDGWSMGVLIREITEYYAAYTTDQPALLPELPIQYADYFLWQRQWLQGTVLEIQLTYWKEQLNGVQALQLPTDYSRPTISSFQGASRTHMLPLPLYKQLMALSEREEVTLFMLLLAAWQVVLARYSDQDDIAVGSPTAGRTHVETEHLIGFFINTLVLRTNLSGNPHFRNILAQVREVCLGAYAHQDVPFEQVVEALQPARDLGRHPLFQVMFVLQNAPLEPLALPGIRLSTLLLESTTAKFDLTLSLTERPQGPMCKLEYRSDLFEAPTIIRMLRHFQTLLEAIVAHPAARLASLPLLTTAERQQLLVEWNATTVEIGDQGPGVRSRIADTCLHTLFEGQVARTPDAIAVTFDQVTRDEPITVWGSGAEDQNGAVPTSDPWSLNPDPLHVTYAELNRRAHQLARHLRHLGVGPEVRVGICLERSMELVIGLLGILKAGGAYLPLDPSYPAERLRFMLDDSQVAVLITAMKDEGRRTMDEGTLIDGLIVQRLLSVQNRVPRRGESKTGYPGGVNPEADNLAYVIYTSGSTGTPKGVMNSHRGITNRLLWMQQTYRLSEADRVLHKTPISFDVSVWEYFWPLLVGARLVIARPGGHQEPTYLVKLIDAQQITTVHFVPTMLELFLQQREVHICTSLRRVICSGEALTYELQQRCFAQLDAELHNLYGPTEAAVDVTHWACSTKVGARGVPIGRPIANTQMYVLDRHLALLPVGAVGELYIGGVQLARGYLNRPDLTAERFVPNPFSDCRLQIADCRLGDSTIDYRLSAIGYRLYKTGDLARYRPDGAIEFLGRIGDQVKLRGFRIELGEIAAVLAQHPSVREAVVLAQADLPGEQRLVAYVVPTNNERRTTNDENHDPSFVHRPSSFVPELRAFLQQRLPDYMIPSAFVLLDALPLSPNGKVDRQALPMPDHTRSALEGTYVAPQTPVEELLAQIWAEVLHLERVGVHDNFFALGGDSILSIQVVSRVNRAGLQIMPRHIFQYQTIAELTAVVGTAPSSEAEQGLVEGPVPLTPVQHWFFEQAQPEPQHFNQALLLELREPLDLHRLENTMQFLIEQHDSLRLRYQRTETGWQQISLGRTPPLAIVRLDLSGLAMAAQDAALAITATQLHTRLDLERGPLIRVALLDLGALRPGRLLLIIHHLAIDGVSWRTLIEDLQTVYSQLNHGAAVALPRKTTSLKQWAERLLDYAQTTALKDELAYWLAPSRRTVARLPIPDDAGPNTVASARTLSVALTSAETRALLQEVPRAYRTQINDVLLTALTQALAWWTGANMLLVDLEGHGRETLFDDLDLSRTLGWFTTIFPVILDLKGTTGPGALLKATKEQLRRVPQRGIGYGLLRYLSRDAAIRTQLQTHAQAEVLFNYLGQIDQALEPTTLLRLVSATYGPLRSPRGTRRYELEISAFIIEGQLQLEWTYSIHRHEAALIAQVADTYIEALRALIAHCLSPDTGGYTPSDFPESELSQLALDDLIAELVQIEHSEEEDADEQA
jgi:amino acid adenylation domain-containing protein/non-ribosomal peptide synthase protein (TIGR01720 family)